MLQKFKKNLFIILLILTSLALINGCETLNSSHVKNANSPTITNSQDLVILENTKAITKITATDIDPNTTITYSVTPNIFTINSQGNLAFKNPAHYQETPYKAHVTAFDGELSSTKTFTITVLKDTDSDGIADITDSDDDNIALMMS